MASLDSMHLARWTLLHPVSVVGQMARGNAIPDYFIAHSELGSPLGAEADWDGVQGGRIQSFSCGVVCWTPDEGARVLTS